MKPTLFRVTNRLGVDETFEDEIEALERAARIGFQARVTRALPVATDQDLARVSPEVIEAVKVRFGAFYREAIAAAVRSQPLPKAAPSLRVVA